MTKRFLLYIALLIPMMLCAQQIDRTKALEKARQFMPGRQFSEAKWLSSARGLTQDHQALYIFNAEDRGGFVIVAGDDRLPSILGYSDSGEFHPDHMPDNLRSWLEGYARQISQLSDDFQPASLAKTRGDKPAIAPLIVTKWGQYEPYNLHCPKDRHNGIRCVTGCEATALAQVMYYHKWPKTSTEIPAYTTLTQGFVVDALPATTFKWDDMKTTYAWGESSGKAAEAVAELMRYAGQSMEMDYTSDGSGANVNISTMVNYFNYSRRARFVDRVTSEADEWEDIIYNELANQRPVIYHNKISGAEYHAFVCDGYDGNGFFHMNWGWDGENDGFYVLHLPVKYQGFQETEASGWERALIGIQSGEFEVAATVDGLRYWGDTRTKTAILVRRESYDLTEVVIPEHITINGEQYTVTDIMDRAFEYADIEKVELPSTLTAIGNYAFSSCWNLTSVVLHMQEPLPINETVFNYPNATLYVPEGTISKYKEAPVWKDFPAICEGNIKRITIDGLNYSYVTGSKVATVLPGSYQYMESLTIPGSIQVDGVDYPVTTIAPSAFEDCYNIKTLTLSKGLETIGESAFYYCRDITELLIPEGVTTIGKYAFSTCYSLRNLDLPSTLVSIGDCAFRNIDLSSVVIRSSVPPSITETTFVTEKGYRVEGTEDQYETVMSIPHATLYVPIGSSAYYKQALGWKDFSAIYEGEPKQTTVDGLNYSYVANSKVAIVLRGDYSEMTDVTIPSTITVDGMTYSVKGIENRAFEYGRMNSLTLSKGLETIGDYAFDCCWRFEQLVLPESLKTIGENAFAYCSGIKKLELPSSLTSIGNNAFWGASYLDEVTVRNWTPLPINADAFYGERTVWNEETQKGDSYVRYPSTLYVPAGAKANYAEAVGWKEFSEIIEKDASELGIALISISSAEQVPYYSDQNLDFTDKTNLKAYVATGYDKATGTIWLSRVKQVPAETGFLLTGEAGTYDIPIVEGVSEVYYKNMFRGTLSGATIYTTDGDYTNYYLSNGESGVGFYKVTKEEGVSIGANRCYLPILTDVPANGSEGDAEVIKVSAAKQVPYYTSKNVDFSSLDAQGVKAYTATGYNYGTGIIWLSRVKKVPAQTGILVMADEAGEYSVPTTSVASVYENMFTGSETAQTIYTTETVGDIEYINYYLSNGTSGVGFYKVTNEDGVSMAANRSYLQIPKRNSAAGARGMEVNASFCKMIISDNEDDVIGIPLFGGETTAISDVLQRVSEEDVWYNLQGQRIDHPNKGLYIRNGRKVVIK